MNRNLINHIARLPNEELVDILTNESDYVPEALNYAKIELQKRQIARNDLDALFEERRLIRDEKKRRREEELSSGEKLWRILFPLYFLSLVALSPILLYILPRGRGAIAYRDEGYYTKASQSIQYTVIGIIFWVTLLILIFTI